MFKKDFTSANFDKVKIMGIDEKVLLDGMIKNHGIYYNEEFWSYIDKYLSGKEKFSILEVACGPGYFIRDINKKYDLFKIIASDIGDLMIKHTKKVINECGITEKSDVLKLDFNQTDWHLEHKSLDVIFVGLAFRNIRVPYVFLENCLKTLKKDGILIIYEFVHNSLRDFTKAWFKKINIAQPSQLNYQVAMNKFDNFCKYAPDDIKYLMELTKFSTIETHIINTPIKTSLIIGKKG